MNHNIHEIIDLLHSDPAGVSAHFHIPLRPIYAWCSGYRKPPAYILNMMYRIIMLERKIGLYGNTKEGLASGMESDQRGIKEISKTSESKIGKA